MLNDLKIKVYEANLELFKKNIVIYTWGNVSEIDRKTNNIVIKPSGISYDSMSPEDMVIVDLKGNVIEGKWNPSSDTLTHCFLYKTFPEIKAICHTHSTNATAFAQAGRPIPALGTTHADYFYGDIPCTRSLSEVEVNSGYEENTGKVISKTLEGKNVLATPGIIVKNHGPFTWGKDCKEAVHNAIVLDKIAEIALKTLQINQKASMKKYILNKHYFRKHGKNAYYGQK